jgi:deoxyribonuclease (pyrimidine dimer)
MTRINLVDPAVLHRKHLVAELHELPRVFSLARNAKNILHLKKIPSVYTLGTGHVLFFYNKLGFLANRYELLCNEMRNRKYNVNQINRTDLLSDIPSSMIKDYNPTSEAIMINQQRIKDRTKDIWK